jgi:hypothetical protein
MIKLYEEPAKGFKKGPLEGGKSLIRGSKMFA